MSGKYDDSFSHSFFNSSPGAGMHCGSDDEGPTGRGPHNGRPECLDHRQLPSDLQGPEFEICKYNSL